MALSKAPVFDKLAYHQSLWSKALSHPARIHILLYLHNNGTTPFHILKSILPLHRTTVSQHLAILRRAGLIRIHEKYPHSYYTLNEKVCCAFLEKMKLMEEVFKIP